MRFQVFFGRTRRLLKGIPERSLSEKANEVMPKKTQKIAKGICEMGSIRFFILVLLMQGLCVKQASAQLYDSVNTIKFIRHFGTSSQDYVKSIKSDKYGGIYIGGMSDGVGCMDNDFYLVKLDKYGNDVFAKNYGLCGGGGDFMDMKITSDDKLLMYGYTTFSILGSNDIYLVKTDLNGNLIWEKYFGTNNGEWGYKILETQDKNYLQLACWNGTWSNSAKTTLIKTDTAGNVLWQKLYNDVCYFKDMRELSNGDILACGNCDTSTFKSPAVFLFDKDGNLKWKKLPLSQWPTFSGNPNEAHQLIVLSENEFVLNGFQDTLIYVNGYPSPWIFGGCNFYFDSLGNFYNKQHILNYWIEAEPIKDGSFICTTGGNYVHFMDRNLTSSSFTVANSYYGFLNCAETIDGYVFGGGWNDNMSSYDYAVIKIARDGSYIVDEYDSYFKVFPNPTDGDISIAFDLLEPRKITATLKGIDGKYIAEIFNQQLNASTSYKYTFHLRDFISNGMCVLELSYGDKKVIKKIVKY